MYGDTEVINEGYFKFNQDSTFYYQKNGFSFKHSGGTWRKNSHKKIVLQSHFTNKSLLLQMEDIAFNSSMGRDSILLSFQIDKLKVEDARYYKLISIINDTLMVENPCNILKFKMPVIDLKCLQFGITTTDNIPARMFDTLFTKKLTLENGIKKNYFKIKIDYNDTLFNYIVFKDYPLRFLTNKIDYNKYYIPIRPSVQKKR